MRLIAVLALVALPLADGKIFEVILVEQATEEIVARRHLVEPRFEYRPWPGPLQAARRRPVVPEHRHARAAARTADATRGCR